MPEWGYIVLLAVVFVGGIIVGANHGRKMERLDAEVERLNREHERRDS